MSYATFARKEADASAAGSRNASKPSRSHLRIGDANDAYEREADRVADKVMNGGAARRHWSLSSTTMAGLPSKCSCGGPGCEARKEKEHVLLQRKADPVGSRVAPPIVHEVLNSPGQPLDALTRSLVESQFGYDFRHVRIHAGARAAESADAANAHAYTAGSSIVFGAGQYRPDTADGLHLLAHELTHVLHQRRAPDSLVQRQERPEPEIVEAPKIGSLIERAFDAADATRWEEAAELANGLSASDLRAFIAALGAEWKTVQLHIGAINNPRVGPKSHIAEATRTAYLNAKFAEQMRGGFYQAASEYLNGLSIAEIRARIGPMKTEVVAGLHAGAVAQAGVGPDSNAAKITAEELNRRKVAGGSAAQPPVRSLAEEQKALRTEIESIPWTDVRGQWASRKEAFVKVATDPDNKLRALQMYQIWLRFWMDKQAQYIREFDIVDKETRASMDPVVYVDQRILFDKGKRNALGPRFEAAADRKDTTNFLFSHLIEVHDWLEIYVDNMGKHVTLRQVNEKALEIARAKAMFQTWFAPIILGVISLGAESAGGPRGDVKGAAVAEVEGVEAKSLGKKVEPPAEPPSMNPPPGTAKPAGIGQSMEGERPTNAQTPTSPASKANTPPESTKATGATGNGLPGFRAEPTLNNAGWGPRPEGGSKGEDYARQITGSDESLYVGGLKAELGGTGIVELDGYRPADRMLLDAKDATPRGMYDVRGGDKFTQNVKIPKIIDEAIRQGHARNKSGAAGIEWSIADEGVADGIEKLFAERGIDIKVVWKPKKGK